MVVWEKNISIVAPILAGYFADIGDVLHIDILSPTEKELREILIKYIRRSMWSSFNALIDRGQNAHREICECSVLFFNLLAKTQNY